MSHGHAYRDEILGTGRGRCRVRNHKGRAQSGQSHDQGRVTIGARASTWCGNLLEGWVSPISDLIRVWG